KQKEKNDLTSASQRKDVSFRGFSVSFFLFLALVFFSGGFFVIASDAKVTDKNIFEDADQDGFSNDKEQLYGTDPNNKDTDGDGYGDGVEIESGYNPLIKAPGDRIVAVVADEPEAVGGLGVDDDGNLTEMASQEIAALLQNASDDQSVSMDQINAAIQD